MKKPTSKKKPTKAMKSTGSIMASMKKPGAKKSSKKC